jgi:hypothetical protein
MVIYDASIYNLSTRLGLEPSGSTTEATNAATFRNPVQVHARLDLLVAVPCNMHWQPFHVHSRSLACSRPHSTTSCRSYSIEVYASISRPLLLLRSMGSSLISTPGPNVLEFLCPGKICSQCVSRLRTPHPSFITSFPNEQPFLLRILHFCKQKAILTLVPPHPSLNAASCANNSPNPNIKPLTNGNTKLIAAPRSMLKNVGGLYSMRGDEECDVCSSESCELLWFAS